MVEAHGIPTVCLSINRAISERIGAPRTVFVRFPHGASFGAPNAVHQQRAVLRDLLWALQHAVEPGAIVDTDHRWRRSEYEPIDPLSFQVRARPAGPAAGAV